MCRQLLESYGELQSFELVRDREKGESKGYGFAIYVDGSITETAIVGLNGLSVEGRILTARRCAVFRLIISVCATGCGEIERGAELAMHATLPPCRIP